MRIKLLIRFGLTVILFLSALINLTAQEEKKERVVVPMKAGYFVAFSTTPTTNVINKDGLSTNFAEAYFTTNSIRRVIVDSGGTLFFGYTLTIEPLLSTKQFKVSVRPLSPEDEQDLRARKSFSTRRLHPNYNAAGLNSSSAPQIINDGDTFALDVLVNQQTGDKLTDIVTISADRARLQEAPVSEPPRDFTLEDIRMKMINYQLFINGELVAGGKQTGACAAPLIWFHLPEQGGRFIFSLSPHAGYDFQKIGTIEDDRIKFTFNDKRYEWISSTHIIGVGGNWNLYVLYDPSYIPDPYLLGVNGASRSEKHDDDPLGLTALERAVRNARSQQGRGGFENPSESQKADNATKSRGARLIIGGGDRIENLLPKN
jgi:hypothetical protein